MWCETCQADVAAIASTEHDRLQCTCCGNVLERMGRSPLTGAPQAETSRTLHPRELLARWAQEDSLPPLEFGNAVARREEERPRKVERPAMSLRFDGSHGANAVPAPLLQEEFPRGAPREAAAMSASAAEGGEVLALHRPHPELAGPHYLPVEQRAPESSSRWMTLVGQILAYAGVGGLTVGTVLVLMAYFGAASGNTGTGWLVAACGQMLLFLGVVTLVSAGMEQTTHEVARRIETLGQRLVRIEQAAWQSQTAPKADSSAPPAT